MNHLIVGGQLKKNKLIIKGEQKSMGKNLGKAFEKQINKVCHYINSIGGFASKLSPERLYDGTYIKGEAFDYIVLMKEYKACFDAKYISGTVWRMQQKDIKQCNNLKKCKNAGLQAYFLICFESGDVRQIDVDTAIDTLKNNSKTISATGNPSWELLKILEAETEQ